MRDGYKTAMLLNKMFDIEVSADEAIEVEQTLFSHLTAENARLREALEEMECLLFANETKSVWEIQSKGTAIRVKALKGERNE